MYSIDECFLDRTGVERDLQAYGQSIRKQVLQWLGLPTCVGIAPTKTLAKLANHTAKKNIERDWAGVCNLSQLDTHVQAALMARIDVGEVWGVGRRLAKALGAMGVHSALDLRRAPAQGLCVRLPLWKWSRHAQT
ncbi:DNA polymerase IV [Pandoraea sputorum]|uniref:DNA polymerase IV n=1 Tax=Pandoraea sputorum TaxID=93222 RepID=A0A5E5BGU3_9BURK|nr:DNA polymerase IV [Pandoraea sputorum]